jgi:hypothetical protein
MNPSHPSKAVRRRLRTKSFLNFINDTVDDFRNDSINELNRLIAEYESKDAPMVRKTAQKEALKKAINIIQEL